MDDTTCLGARWNFLYVSAFASSYEHSTWLLSCVFRGVKKFARNGINNGLQLLLDAENYDYASPIKSKAGFMFTVLHQLDIAILKQTGSIAMPGQSVQVAITPTLTDTIPSAKIRFNPIDRQCYFDNEINLEHLPSFGYRLVSPHVQTSSTCLLQTW